MSLNPVIVCKQGLICFFRKNPTIIPRIFIGTRIYDIKQYIKLQSIANKFINKLLNSYNLKIEHIKKNIN